MFESKVYECQTCREFFFFEQDTEDHKKMTGHAQFKITDWSRPSTKVN